MKELDTKFLYYNNLEKEKINRVASKYNVKYSEYLAIKALDFVDGASIHDLDEMVELDSLDKHHIIHRLLDKEFVEIKEEKIYLTEDMKSTYKKIKTELNSSDDKFIEEFGFDRYQNLLKELNKAISVLSSL